MGWPALQMLGNRLAGSEFRENAISIARPLTYCMNYMPDNVTVRWGFTATGHSLLFLLFNRSKTHTPVVSLVF